MRVWLVQTGEPAPTDPGRPKLMRTGVVAQHLADRGHEVVLWSCTVDHPAKVQRARKTTVLEMRGNYHVVLLYGRMYASNISLARVVSQIETAREFRRLAPTLAKPDVILCGYPTIELAHAATKFAVQNAIPIAIDFRDKWPDIIESHISRWARRVAVPAIWYWRHCQRWTVRNATGIVAITEPFLDWALAAGGRVRSDRDRVFHLAADPAPLSPGELADAERMWDALDVRAGGDRVIVCFIGTLSSRLDLMTLVAGVRGLSPEEKTKVKVVICGRGDLDLALREVAKSEPGLVVAGWRKAAELHVLMQRSHAGVLPYRSNEDFVISYPNKVGEYLGAGLPIMTGLSGLVGKLLVERGIGFFYEAGNPASAVACLRGLLASPAQAQQKRDAARQAFLDLFDPARIYPGFCDYLEDLAAEHGSRT